MAVNKIVINNETKIDLTNDTVDASSLLVGTTAHDKSGEVITGTVSTITVYSGTDEPTTAIGNTGDIYLVLEA